MYAKGGTGPYTKARNGLFAVISVKEKATRAAPAAQAVSLDGGGWKWVAPDGRATDSGSGNGAAIVQGGGHGNIVQPGTYDLTQVAFDIPEAARGGTLMFLDARGHIFRWKVPAKDSGPGAAELARKVRDDLT
ncbi:hypothetical protein [Streptomyces sp. I05A-00742]|uniref:hypothetical protein n=1 Tax=Streptomyces sp. I05A-00742 TaxID=2732853 RepID=UPI00148868C5|nr:hypothetical protein [Streptomyces sp. I05A-00742]